MNHVFAKSLQKMTSLAKMVAILFFMLPLETGFSKRYGTLYNPIILHQENMLLQKSCEFAQALQRIVRHIIIFQENKCKCLM